MCFIHLATPNLYARAAAALILACTLSAGVSAQSLRCKGDFAQIGNSKGTILQKCGEPVLKDSFCKPASQTTSSETTSSETTGSAPALVPDASGARGAVTNATINQCINVDEWTYNPGYGQFMTMLQFEAGELKRINYGDRVTR